MDFHRFNIYVKINENSWPPIEIFRGFSTFSEGFQNCFHWVFMRTLPVVNMYIVHKFDCHKQLYPVYSTAGPTISVSVLYASLNLIRSITTQLYRGDTNLCFSVYSDI